MSISSHNDVFYPTINNSAVIRALLSDRIWEKKITNLFKKFIKPNQIVIDCGSYIGTHTLTMSKLAGKVYAFEPQPLIAKCIRKTLQTNMIENVVFTEVACSNQIGVDNIFTNNDGDASLSGIRDHKFTTNYVCYINTLDNLIPNNERISLIKIDVEGSEWEVLSGAKNIIKSSRPIIILETFNTKKNLIKLDKWINDYGYSKQYITSVDVLLTPF
jgi:FkbM family methyltransferase